MLFQELVALGKLSLFFALRGVVFCVLFLLPIIGLMVLVTRPRRKGRGPTGRWR